MELIYNQANWYPVTNKQSKPRGILPAMAGGSARKGSFFNGGYTDILKLKCWVINLLQFSQTNWIYWFNIPSKGPSMIADIPPLKFEVSGITRLLRNINAKKACGPDNISLTGFWKKLRLSLPHFSSIFYSINTKQVKCQVTGSLQMSPQFSKKESQKAK